MTRRTAAQAAIYLPTDEIPRGSVDFITATVKDDRGNDLDMGVEIAVTAIGDSGSPDEDVAHAWLTAEWLDDPASERKCQTVVPVDTSLIEGPNDASDLDDTWFGVFVRLDNSPAHPIILVGRIVLVD